MAVEKKQGISNLELTCRELLEEEQAKEQRRVQKRQKKKKKKTTKANDVGPCEEAEEDELICTHDGKENCKVCGQRTVLGLAVQFVSIENARVTSKTHWPDEI